MIEGLKPYGEYKESGSKWLGKVPAEWQIRSLRTMIQNRSERNRPDLPLLSVAREKGVFVRSLTDPNENHNVIPDDLCPAPYNDTNHNASSRALQGLEGVARKALQGAAPDARSREETAIASGAGGR